MSPHKLILIILACYPATAFGGQHVAISAPSHTRDVCQPRDNKGIICKDEHSTPRAESAAAPTNMMHLKVGDPSLFGHPGDPLFQVYGTENDPASYSGRVSLAQLARFVQSSVGDNKSFVGGNTLYVEARDRDDVTATTKGVLYPIYATISPRLRRDNVPNDDANGVSVMNITGVKGASGTDAFYLAHNDFAFGDKISGSREWLTGITLDANLGLGIQVTGKIDTYALDFGLANVVSGKAIRLGNGQGIYSRSHDGREDILIAKSNAQDAIEIGKNSRPLPVSIYAGDRPSAIFTDKGVTLDSGASLSLGSKVALLSDNKTKSIQIGTREDPIQKGYIASPVFSVRIITTGARLTLRPDDWMVVIRKPIASLTTIVLPPVDAGATFIVKDGRGDASKNAITVVPSSGTIDGLGSYTIASNHGWVNLTYDGTEWLVH